MLTWERSAQAVSSAPPERVWAVLTDGRRWSQWNAGVQWIEIEGPLAPGTLLTMKPKGAPQTAFRIAAALPPHLLAFAVTFGPLATLEFRYELRPEGAQTAIVQTIGIGGPFAAPLLRKRAERIADAMPANLERLAARAAAPA
ncbi:hypothetical protein WPS_07160 [Vulcanimicrobium alpinum]|uniref:Polyketide cyclase n=1 Tax=Vulcanimicrobium alpinum TaxID=3016050 RepID=A0AAN1XUX8_UNVUL|nr:SRPBCC family protein [Vulcanimicrobium alpinum]BDE05440.1 hypothetical protein WPS_07160 [Vulcanimicrobium alpinum]